MTVRLTKSEAADLDTHAQARGFRSRSAAVRDAVDRVITAEQKREKKQRGRKDLTADVSRKKAETGEKGADE